MISARQDCWDQDGQAIWNGEIKKLGEIGLFF